MDLFLPDVVRPSSSGTVESGVQCGRKHVALARANDMGKEQVHTSEDSTQGGTPYGTHNATPGGVVVDYIDDTLGTARDAAL